VTHAIEIRNISKTFGTHRAVDDVSLDVPVGSIYGFIGPNGSGKTTTIRMIMNIILPDSGEVVVMGSRDSGAARDEVSYLPEERGLYKQMPVRRLLRYYGRLKGRRAADLDPIITRWLDRLGLSAWADKRIDTLSKGMAQKVQFISAVVSEPKLLILDEPFSGLDPVNADASNCFIAKYDRNGWLQWVRAATSSYAWPRINKIAIDPAGNVFVAGWSLEPVSFGDVVVTGNSFLAKFVRLMPTKPRPRAARPAHWPTALLMSLP